MSSAPSDHASTLGRRYQFVLILVASLVVLDQAVVQPNLVRLSLFAPVINVAGRQRMLSQRLTKAALIIGSTTDAETRRNRLSELRSALAEFREAHHGLQRGSEVLQIPELTNPSILTAFDDLDPWFRAMTSAAESLAEAESIEARQRHIQTIVESETEFLSRMDAIVGMFEEDAREHVVWLRFAGLVMMAAVLLLLLGLGLRVLRPAIELVKQQFDAVTRSEERYRLVVDRMSDGLAVYQRGGKLLYVNERLCDLLGHERDTLLEKPLASFADSESREQLLELLARSERMTWQTSDIVWRHREGNEVFTQVSVGSVHGDLEGEPTFFTVVTDLTRRKRDEDRLRAAHAQLEQRVEERTQQLTVTNAKLTSEISQKEEAQERMRQLLEQLAHTSRIHAIGQLATGLAHELNQPLGAISNYAEGCLMLVGEDHPRDPQRVRTGLDRIRKSAMRAGAIIRRMRTFIQRQPRELITTDLNDLVREVVDLCEPEARQQDITIDLHLNPEPLLVDLESIQVQQVLVNLIQNGFQAMRNCERDARRMTIRTDHRGRDAEVSVADTGTGFPEAEGNVPFEPFFTTKPDGLGMGLSISQEIISDHRGTLRVGNNAQGGAIVSFALPLREPSAETSLMTTSIGGEEPK